MPCRPACARVGPRSPPIRRRPWPPRPLSLLSHPSSGWRPCRGSSAAAEVLHQPRDLVVVAKARHTATPWNRNPGLRRTEEADATRMAAAVAIRPRRRSDEGRRWARLQRRLMQGPLLVWNWEPRASLTSRPPTQVVHIFLGRQL